MVENVLDIRLHSLYSDCNVKLHESAFEPTAQSNKRRLFNFAQNVKFMKMYHKYHIKERFFHKKILMKSELQLETVQNPELYLIISL